MVAIEPTPGIHKGVPFIDYLRWPILSQSVLKEGRESMAHLHAALLGHTAIEPTDDMILGSALHTAFLEPDLFSEKVALWNGKRRYGNEWDAFQWQHRGKAILTPGFYERCVGMVEALRRHPEVMAWQDRIEAVEVSCVGSVAGVPFKGRVDALTADPIWDIKKTRKTTDRAINATILAFGYHIQAYCYRELFNRDRFCLAFVEDRVPYDVRVVELSDTWLKIGEQETVGLLQSYQHCMKTGVWPGRSDTIEIIEPPTFLSDLYSAADEITFEGEAAFVKE